MEELIRRINHMENNRKEKFQDNSVAIAEKEHKLNELPVTDFLRNEIITVKYIKRETAYIKDPKHVGYGGLFENSSIAIPVPVLDNSKMKNILTNKEKAGLEYLLKKDLSIYGNFWKEEYKKGGLFPIFLGKDDVKLDLSDAIQYLIYKVLLVSPLVAPSLEEIRNKATYRFVMVAEGEELRKEKDSVGNKVIAFEKYVEFKNKPEVLRYILRNLGRYTSKGQDTNFLQVETAKMIEKDPNLFVAITADEFIETKVLLEEAFENGVVKRNDKKYYTLDDQPISEGDTPILETSARYLASPIGQEMRLAIQAKLKNSKQ